jgi:DNA repair exonuclease SbcCD ATPase subunit
MICPNCHKEIFNKASSCPYCGKILLSLPESNTSVIEKTMEKKSITPEVEKVVKNRRKQRWFFYFLIFLIFSAAVFFIVKAYNDNAQLIIQINQANTEFEEQKKSLEDTKSKLLERDGNLAKRSSEYNEINRQLEAKNSEVKELNTKTQDLQANLDKTTKTVEDYNNLVYNLIYKTGFGLKSEEIKAIPLSLEALKSLKGTDTDGDGLIDELEDILATDKTLADTDGDGYNDFVELSGNFNPSGSGSLVFNEKIINNYKGKIIYSSESQKDAWYVSFNGVRYYLGLPANNFKALQDNDYWSKVGEVEN